MPSYNHAAWEHFVSDTQQIPSVLTALSTRSSRVREDLSTALRGVAVPGVLLAGMGSSHYASAMTAQRLQARGVAAIAVSAEDQVPPCAGWPLIAVSNEGRTAELVSFIDRFRGVSDAPVIAVTGGVDGPIAGAADLVVDPGAGREGAFATKSFVGSLAALRILAGVFTGETHDELLGAAAQAEGLLAADSFTTRRHTDDVTYFLGSGECFGIAQQAALVMSEAARVPSIAMEKGEYLHGTANVLSRLRANVVLIGTSPFDDVIRERVAQSPTGTVISDLVPDWDPEHSPLAAMAAIASLVAAQWQDTVVP